MRDMVVRARKEAALLVEIHGRKAQQVVVDQIVAAVRAGNDDAAAGRNDVLRAIEKLLSDSVPVAGGSGRASSR